MVQALEADIDGGLRRELWLNLPPINHSTLIRVADTTMRPEPQGTGIVFVPYSGEVVGIETDNLLQCRPEARSEYKSTTRIFATAQLLPTWNVATFGSGATRILQMMVKEGRATILRAVGGFMVVMAERMVRHGEEISLHMLHAFHDPSLTAVVKGTLTQVSALQATVETASLIECKRKLIQFFQTGRVGILSVTRVGDDGLLQQTKGVVVSDDICLRDQIRHPALYDSRGLRAVEEVQAMLSVRVVAVGPEQQHLLLGRVSEGSLMPAWDEHDPRFLAWDPVLQGWDSLLKVVDRSTEKRSGGEVASGADVGKQSKIPKSSAETGGDGTRHSGTPRVRARTTTTSVQLTKARAHPASRHGALRSKWSRSTSSAWIFWAD